MFGRTDVKNITKELIAVLLAVLSVVALFADTESTGNLSMALNGDGIAQSIFFVCLILLYRKVIKEKKYWEGMELREIIAYLVLSAMFSASMIIGRAQTAEPYLKYGYIAAVMFAGYLCLFFVLIRVVCDRLKDMQTQSDKDACGKITKWLFEEHVILGVMAVIFVCRLPYLIAFYPCSMTWDGGAQISSFYGIEPFTDHHPPLLSFLYGNIAMYSQEWGIPNIGMFLIPLMNTTLSAYTAAKIMELFKHMRVPYWVRWSSIIYYAVFTVWCIFDVTVIKDSLYWQFAVLFTIQMIYLLFWRDDLSRTATDMLKLALYAILMTQTRNNGIFVLIFTLPTAFIIINRKKKPAFAATVVMTSLAVFIINNIVWQGLGVTKIEVKEDTYCIMFQQTAKYGQDHPDDVTDEERQFLNTLFDYDELVEVYNPNLADWVKNCLKICEANSPDHTNKEFAAVRDEYFKVWFAQFKRHPLSYINTFFECSYGYYYPEVKPYKEGNGFYEMDRNMFTESMHDARQIESLASARFILSQVSKIEYMPGVGLLYRCGFYTWCVAFAVMVLLVRKRYREAVIALPAVVNILVCLISPVNTCIRYCMPTMCFVPVLIAVICSKERT